MKRKIFTILFIIIIVAIFAACMTACAGEESQDPQPDSQPEFQLPSPDPKPDSEPKPEPQVVKWKITYTSNNYKASDLTEPVERVTDTEGVTGITVTPAPGYKFVGWSDGVTNSTRIDSYAESQPSRTVEAIFEYDFLNLPVFDIRTADEAEITDKENYVDCTVSLLNVEDGYAMDELKAGIRLRGNSTINYPKKPYRIKFDKKQSPFGWEKNKSWVLLAMYIDYSNIKDYAAFSFARSLNTGDFVPHAQHVEVYLNGVFQGLYLFCDQVDEKEGRTDVEVKEDYFDTAGDEVPFLVELDEYSPLEGNEDEVWFKIENDDATSYYNVKYPKSDDGYDYTQEQFQYIKNYIVTVDALCRNPEVTKDQFEEYVDLDSFIDYYLVQEFVGQTEINWKSVYMSKEVGGKLKMGPIWDFDWAAGGSIGAIDHWYSDRNWFGHMLKVDWFKDEVAGRWKEIRQTLLNKAEELTEVKSVITPATARNALVWQADSAAYMNFDEYFDWVIAFYKNRAAVMDNLLGVAD